MKIDGPVGLAVEARATQMGPRIGEESAPLSRSLALERIEALMNRASEATVNAIIDLVQEDKLSASAEISSQRAEIRRQQDSADESNSVTPGAGGTPRGQINRDELPQPVKGHKRHVVPRSMRLLARSKVS